MLHDDNRSWARANDMQKHKNVPLTSCRVCVNEYLSDKPCRSPHELLGQRPPFSAVFFLCSEPGELALQSRDQNGQYSSTGDEGNNYFCNDIPMVNSSSAVQELWNKKYNLKRAVRPQGYIVSPSYELFGPAPSCTASSGFPPAPPWSSHTDRSYPKKQIFITFSIHCYHSHTFVTFNICDECANKPDSGSATVHN